MDLLDPARTALIVIDVQQAFDALEAELQRNNPEALDRIVDLLTLFRAVGAPIFHIRHAGQTLASRFHPDLPGHRVKAEARERPGEPVLTKSVNSSFIGTDLEARLRAGGIRSLVIVGATTNHCVETTARMAGNLGFDAKLVRDATWTFERTGPDGDHHTAEAIHAMTLANLSGEFAEIVTATGIAGRLQKSGL
ncbi:MAG TPA: cysteine hydrolase family protein [Aliidongia sp.]|nr:cysteine hydrolase family protein [Aliidongia sp.]